MLHLAVIYNMVDIVERLVKLGEDRNVKNKVYNTLIASASRKKWPKLVFKVHICSRYHMFCTFLNIYIAHFFSKNHDTLYLSVLLQINVSQVLW